MNCHVTVHFEDVIIMLNKTC